MEVKGQGEKYYYTHEELMVSVPRGNVSNVRAAFLILVSQNLTNAQTFPSLFREERDGVTCSRFPGYHHISLFLRFLSSSVNQCESVSLKREST